MKKIKSDSSNNDSYLGRLVLIVAVIEPFMAIPQILEIFKNKNAGSVSLVTWFLYIFSTTIWFLYGIKIKDRPLIITGLLSILIYIPLVIAIVVY